MHSSIFSSRVIPNQSVKAIVFQAMLISALLLCAWEIYCRAVGYEPSINDSAELWVTHREYLDDHPNATVLIGASRILFGFDLDQFESAFGEKPVQLSTIGVNAGIYLEHLASSPEFKGTVILGYAPGLYFAGGGGPVQTPLDNIRKYETFTTSETISYYIGTFFDKHLAFIQPDDLTLGKMIERLGIPNREGTHVPPDLPPYFYTVDERRQGGLGARAESDAEFAKHIENIWLGLMAPHNLNLPEDVRRQQELENIERVVANTVASVNKIRARGGNVIFIRYPSSGPVRELEAELTPRAKYWDRIIAEAGIQGIHFEDYDSLKNFTCPEGGHLSRSDRYEFTARLIPLLKEAYAGFSLNSRLISQSDEAAQTSDMTL